MACPGKLIRVAVFDRLYGAVRCTLGGMFIYAGFLKLLEPGSFAVLIEAYGILPQSMCIPVAIGLPLVEVIAGVGLLFDIQGSLAIITGLLAVFIAVLGYAIWLGIDVDCGCFGPDDPETKAFHGLRASLQRDLFLIAVVGFLYVWRRYRFIRPIKLGHLYPQMQKLRRKESRKCVCIKM